MSWLIGRAINGVTINGREYLLDGDGNSLEFDTEQSAWAHLRRCGISKRQAAREGIEVIEEAGLNG